jgi:diacylglycerol O-acyltransferase / wax synthase
MKQLSGMDASFLYMETPNAPGHIFSVWIYDQSSAPGGKITFKEILHHVGSRLHVSRTFRQRLVEVPLGLDHPYWIEDPEFDLEYHVRHIALPRPGDWRQFCIQVARLHSRPLDRSRPLWEMYVIEGLDDVAGLPAGSFAIMTKIHHAAIDGVTLLEITSALNDIAPDTAAPATSGEWRPERLPSSQELLSRAAVNAAVRPMRMARLTAAAVPGNAERRREQRARQNFDLSATSPVPRTRFSGTVTTHRVIEARRFELATAKAIKAAVPGATINDVAITVVGGALREYLREHGELPEQALRVMAPISTRTPEQAGTAGNQVSAMIVTAGTDVADPRQRLAAVHESTAASKAAAEAAGARDLAQFSELMPGGLVALAARTASQFEMATRTNPLVNTVVSNVPGSQVPLYFAGARLVTFFGGAGVADGMGLLHGVSSYVGQLILSVVSDREMLPDPGHYADLLETSFTDLAEATGVTAKTTSRKATTARPRKAATARPRKAATARPRKAATASPRKAAARPRKAAARPRKAAARPRKAAARPRKAAARPRKAAAAAT